MEKTKLLGLVHAHRVRRCEETLAVLGQYQVEMLDVGGVKVFLEASQTLDEGPQVLV